MDYPPVYNLARYLASHGVCVRLLNGKRKESTLGLNDHGVLVFEVDMGSNSVIKRYFAYGFLYFKAFWTLLINPGVPIIYFESISSPPVFVYFALFPFSSRKLAIHFHEYWDKKEHKKQSFLERFGRRLEPFLFKKAHWISHTNRDRLERFNSEFSQIDTATLQILPNYPPESWALKRKDEQIVEKDRKIRLIYVGAVSLETLYLSELVNWLNTKKGEITCDVYSKNIDHKVISFLNSNDPDVISYKGSLDYNDIPNCLQHYDVGLILYTGIESSNVTYSAPNKLFEYMVCGLDVWFSSSLLSTYQFETINTYPKVVKVDFTKLNKFDYRRALCREGCSHKESIYAMESVNSKLYSAIIGTKS